MKQHFEAYKGASKGGVFAYACFVLGSVRWIPCDLLPCHNLCPSVPSICLCIASIVLRVGIRRYIGIQMESFHHLGFSCD